MAVAIVGGGPAGLMAAEMLSRAGVAVDLYDAMPSVGRKLLMAGKGGLNITHSEPESVFLTRYGKRAQRIAPLLEAFGPSAVRAWMAELGIASFVGSSGRVFPIDMKAAPLLRSWLRRLRAAGVRFHLRHRWQGWKRCANGDTELSFATAQGEHRCVAPAVLLALGGGSWRKLGSDGSWFTLLAEAGIELAALRPANCGFDVGWSRHLRENFAGQPIKPVLASIVDRNGHRSQQRGEFVLTDGGVEGGLIYWLSATLRDEIEACGSATLFLDLLPDHDLAVVVSELARRHGARSLASHLQGRLHLKGAKVALLHECAASADFATPERLAAAIKALPICLTAPRPLDEAISSAGGVRFEGLDAGLMLRELPGVFCAGEMLDWEAPTGGYLLTACLASGRAAGLGALAWLNDRPAHAGATVDLVEEAP